LPESAPAIEAKRVLIIAPHSSYRTAAYIQAAQHLNIEVLIASEGKYSIVGALAKGLHIRFSDQDAAFTTIIEAAEVKPFAAVIGTDDSCLELASRVALHFSLPHNSPESVRLASRKDLARECLSAAHVAVPAFKRVFFNQDLEPQIIDVEFPAVLKPIALSGSRGVIRVNNVDELQQALSRVKNLLDAEQQLPIELREQVLIEQYLPGQEVAVEGILNQGQLQILTIFDKPDPLEGPFFEETYYITPSRHSLDIQHQLQDVVQKACVAYGLVEGPIHAECRINDEGVWILEVAARTIGGLCAQLLTHSIGQSLEALVLSQAMGLPLLDNEQRSASGVLMIPIPEAGVFKRVEGLLQAQRVAGITDINIQIREGYQLVPLPEGASYLGFIFSQADSAKEVEAALRKAHAHLNIIVTPLFQVNVA